ncbi:hypothetical protein J2847_006443 [Azospirillum agricola]|uniref:DUF6362 family protein n=1 Tax=Azospirillum agricola TaxID=1720247 RepID=UPI001AEA225C|nr:DUF6362 family protein [Azospirillum agricola]MBP2233108.1 hypothetical protein [Azospirillum agricola]
MGRKKQGRDRRAARQLTARELRERAVRQQDRATRSLLAQAESLRFSISDTRHIPMPTMPTTTRTVSYPVGGRRGAHDDYRRAPHTATAAIPPWQPAPGEELLEGPWGGSGGWTVETVREWLAEAMETLRACPKDHPGGWRSSMPDVIHQAALAYGWSEARIRILPTPSELGRLDVVLQWLFLLEGIDQRKAVTAVAMGISLRRVAKALHCSHTHVATLERKAVELLVATLNG